MRFSIRRSYEAGAFSGPVDSLYQLVDGVNRVLRHAETQAKILDPSLLTSLTTYVGRDTTARPP